MSTLASPHKFKPPSLTFLTTPGPHSGNRSATPSPRLSSAIHAGHHHVYALHPAAARDVLLELVGEFSALPNRYSVQLDTDLHLAPPADLQPGQEPDAYLWRFLNHACRPNAAIAGRQLVALRAIAAGEEVTFDYNTTELELAEPFNCHCGACGGRLIRGFKHLSPAEQAQLAPHLAPHLARLLPSPVPLPVPLPQSA